MKQIDPLKILNIAVVLQQQRYIVAISYLFYIQNGLTLTDFLLFQSIFYFTGLLAEIPAGYIGDIFPRRNVLMFSYLLFIVRIVMWIIAPNYLTILLGEILYGLSKSFYRGVSDGYIYDYLKEKKSTELMTYKYGKLNSFISIGSAISCLAGAWLYEYLGFKVLLFIELFFNTTALLMLYFIPNVKQTKAKYSCKEHCVRIFNSIKNTLTNNDINAYLIYAGILFGTTSVFVWNFQPFMKTFAFPVYLFGVIYFINHILRAVCSANTAKFLEKISLKATGWLVWGLYSACFVLMISVLKMNNKYYCFAVLLFICVAIGIQMVFTVGNTSRLHKLITSDTRATISSINSMFSSFFSVIFLSFYRNLADNNSIMFALGVFAVMFIFSLFILKRIQTIKTP